MSIRAKPGLLGVADGASASVGGGVSSSGSGATKTGEVSEAGSVSSESIVAVLTSGWTSSAAPASIVALYVSEPFSLTSAAFHVSVRVDGL